MLSYRDPFSGKQVGFQAPIPDDLVEAAATAGLSDTIPF